MTAGRPAARRAMLAAGLALGAAIPLVVRDTYYLHLVNLMGIAILLTSGLNIVQGYAGQISLGQAGFYAVGAYTSALLVLTLNVSVWVAMLAGGAMGALFGVLIGPVVRLREYALAMATLAFGEIVSLVLFNWHDLTRGPRGLLNIPFPQVGGFVFGTEARYFYLIYAWVLVHYAALWRLVHSPVGRAFRALRDDPLAAEAAGIPVTAYKVMAFTLAGFFAGIAGALYAHLTGFISPYNFSLDDSLRIFMVLMIGGEGSLLGPIFGSALLTLLPEALRRLEEFNLLVYGALLLLVLIFAPRGLAGLVDDARRALAGLRRRS